MSEPWWRVGSSERTPASRLRRHERAGAVALAILAVAGGVWAQPATPAPGAAPLALAAAIAAAQRGPDVRIAELQLESALIGAQAAGVSVSGTARTGASLGWSDGAITPSSGLQSLGISATLNVVPYGPRQDALERAVQAAEAAERALHTVRTNAAIAAAERWWAASRAEASLALARARLDLAERQLEVVQVQAAAGTAGPAALADAGLVLAQASLDVAAAEVDAIAALRALAQLLGAPVDELAPRDEDVRTAAARLSSAPMADAQVVAAAVAQTERVRTAQQGLRDAEAAAERALRDTAPTVSLSASVGTSGDAGRVSLGAGWDTRSYQPSLDLSVDPFSPGPPSTSAAVGISVSMSFGTTRGLERAGDDIAVALAGERLESAFVQAQLELVAQLRSLEATLGHLAMALDRARLRDEQERSRRLRADLGELAPLEIERAELDDLQAELALAGSLDAARLAAARFDLALGFDPITRLLDRGARAALDTGPTASQRGPGTEEDD